MTPLIEFCVLYYGTAIVWGMREPIVWQRSTGDFLLTVAQCYCLAVWTLQDARGRNKPISLFQRDWLVLLAGIAVPAYLVVTRGWKGVGWVFFHAIAWLVVATIATQITGFLYYGGQWWRLYG